MSPPRLAIITALPQELDAVQAAFSVQERQNVTLVRGGEGRAAATEAVRKLLASPQPPALICSSGFCGGLQDCAAVGDIILANAILGPNDGERYGVDFDTPGVDALRLALTEARVQHHVGAIVSVAAAVLQPEEKRTLGAARKALAVDMESYAIADVVWHGHVPLRAREDGGTGSQQQTEAARGTPAVFVLRVVSDSVDDALPEEVDTFLDAEGRVRLGSVARFALSSPRNVKVLWSMKANMEKSTAALTAAWRAVWPAIKR
jgi:hypothetical protein